MLSHRIFPTAFGHSGILFQKKPLLVKRIFPPLPHKRCVQEYLDKMGLSKPGKTPAIVDLCRAIQAYFEGMPIRVPWEWLDMEDRTPLQRAVLHAVSRIPFGEIRSYGRIADEIGHPRACRFVGTTLARNPYPILIPCHRVILADGSTGRFSGGPELKKKMILLERGLTSP